MRYLPIHHSMLGLFTFIVLCPSTTIAMPVDTANEDTASRTTSCVRGGLPMEVQFDVSRNPPKFVGPVFDIQAIDVLTDKLDARIAHLLKMSVLEAWNSADKENGKLSKKSFARLRADLIGEIVERAPKALGIWFCGEATSVGNAAFAAIIEYFARSVELDGGRTPTWLSQLDQSVQSQGASIVMMAVALRLANIDFDPMTLVRLAQ